MASAAISSCQRWWISPVSFGIPYKKRELSHLPITTRATLSTIGNREEQQIQPRNRRKIMIILGEQKLKVSGPFKFWL
jgi:hypothetical protein